MSLRLVQAQNEEVPADIYAHLEDELIFIKQMQDELKTRYDNAKKELFDLFDANGAEGRSYRHTSLVTGKVLCRELRPIDPYQHPKIDITKLQSLLTPEQWNAVTDLVPALNEAKLVDAIENNAIPNILEQVISYPEQVATLYYRDPKPEDEMELKVVKAIRKNAKKTTKKI